MHTSSALLASQDVAPRHRPRRASGMAKQAVALLLVALPITQAVLLDGAVQVMQFNDGETQLHVYVISNWHTLGQWLETLIWGHVIASCMSQLEPTVMPEYHHSACNVGAESSSMLWLCTAPGSCVAETCTEP